MTLTAYKVAEPATFDPGIPGFIRASRHLASGSYLVMTEWVQGGEHWLGLCWVKRLIHNADRHYVGKYRVLTQATRKIADRTFDYNLLQGPPGRAITDYQRQRVYRWETKFIFPTDLMDMPWHGCLFFAKYVWSRVGAGKPLIISDESRGMAALSYGGKIVLPDTHPILWTKPIILHEIAHELTPDEGHGPIFVRRYIDLCVRFLGLSRKYLERTATENRVDFSGLLGLTNI
jgi:hypothetical protein